MSKKNRVIEVLKEAKKLAQEYRVLTGKPLGITGEVAEYEAARILGVELTPARQPGYDAIERKAGDMRHLQKLGAVYFLLRGSEFSQPAADQTLPHYQSAALSTYHLQYFSEYSSGDR